MDRRLRGHFSKTNASEIVADTNHRGRALRALHIQPAHAKIRAFLYESELCLCWSVSWAHKLRHMMAHVPAAADRTDPSKMVPDNLSSWVRSAPQNQSHIEAEIFKSVPSSSSGIYYTSATMAAALQTLSTSALTVKAVRPCRRSRATVTKARHPCHNNLAMNSTT